MSRILALHRISFLTISKDSYFRQSKNLYTDRQLNLDIFTKERKRAKRLFEFHGDEFKKKMYDIAAKDIEVISTDLKAFIHLCDKSNDDLNVLLKLILCQRMSTDSYKSSDILEFNYMGPVVMKLFAFHNLPFYALNVLKDKKTSDYFDHLYCYQLAMNLLFENGCYKEVLDVSAIAQTRNKHLASSLLSLTATACYKMNSQESLWKAARLIRMRYKTYTNRVPFRPLFAVAMLALNTGNDDVAQEMLSYSETPSHFLFLNLKILLNIQQSNYEQILSLLKDTYSWNIKKPVLSSDMLAKLNEAFVNCSNSQLKLDFLYIINLLRESNLVTDQTLEDCIMEPIKD